MLLQRSKTKIKRYCGYAPPDPRDTPDSIMPNILITNYCNRACPYCFAKEKIRKQGKGIDHTRLSITLEDVDYIIKFLKKSKHHLFSILGGEPTLHPQFTYIVDQALKNGLKVRIFTNGLLNKKKQKYLFRNNIDIILNINEPDEISSAPLKKLEKVCENLGPNIYPAFNIYKEDFDFSFIFDLIERYYMPKVIRIGLSQPIISGGNVFIPPDQYRKIGEKIVGLAEKADKRNIRLSFDCGFVLCMFSKTDIGKLLYSNADMRFVCGPTIDIDPELTVWHCFPLSSIGNKNLKEFKDLNGLVSHYEKIGKSFAHVGMFAKCSSCTYLKRQQCSGGCIAHKIRRNPKIMQRL